MAACLKRAAFSMGVGMAATRLMAIHQKPGRSVAASIKEKTDYIMNRNKTNDGLLIRTYACHAESAVEEFIMMRREYEQRVGQRYSDKVLAYQIRQAFKPGEVSPEEANQIGYDLSMRFLKGKHAFIVATHVDKAHVHNHIIFSATALDYLHKFRDFLGSGKAVARLSDAICTEHALSVIEHPAHKGMAYNVWAGRGGRFSARDQLRFAIDEALARKPEGLDALIRLLGDAGWQVKRGTQFSFRSSGGKNFIRLDTLGENYSEENLRAVLAGTRQHIPWQRRIYNPEKISLLIDINNRMRDKGAGYVNWAKVFNLKQMSKSMMYIKEQGIYNYEELSAKVAAVEQRQQHLKSQIAANSTRLDEILAQKKIIYNYLKTKNVYAKWRESGWSGKFAAAHKEELQTHKDAKKAFEVFKGTRIPTLKELTAEYDKIVQENQINIDEQRRIRTEQRDLLMAKANIDRITERFSPQEVEVRSTEQDRS